MRLFLATLMCKLLYLIGRLVGKGSSLPGRVALAVCPNALSRVRLPKTIIAVTGSNGKTSTTELLAHSLKANGLNVGWNHEGANQIEGVATMILRNSSFGGAVKCDALLFESDERYAHQTFKAVPPTVLVVTNLFRDQLTRNGHPEFIQDCIRKAIDAAIENGSDAGGPLLVLNADDPYVTALAPADGSQKSIYFGISADANRSAPNTGTAAGMYDDGAFCPVCKTRMRYDYRITAHLGGYKCDSCGRHRPDADIELSRLDAETGEAEFKSGKKTRLSFPSLTNAYNLAAAMAASAAVGVGAEASGRALDGFELSGGRTKGFSVGGRAGMLLVSKHENSVSYNQSLEWVANHNEKCTVVILVDSISRKYYTSETSWLWDIDFDILAACNVRDIVLAGRYANELAARFAMTVVDAGKISSIESLGDLRGHVESATEGGIFALTCFSDKDKLLKALAGGK